MYHLLFDAVSTHPTSLADKVPSFIINETIFFFEGLEEYEKCATLKGYFELNPNKLIPMSRKDYLDFGWQLMSRSNTTNGH